MSIDQQIKNKEEIMKNNVQELWEQSQDNFVVEKLRDQNDLQEIMESLKNFKEAFSSKLDTIVCSDERVPAGEGKKIGFAGQLILASEEEVAKFAEKYKGKVNEVTSHEDCGAAKKKFDLIMTEGGALPEGITTADELGSYHSKKLAEILGAKYRHIPSEEMMSKVHNARAICFDATGKFNPAILDEMPDHFVCSGPGFGLSSEYLKQELAILTGIALGSHGFYNNFSSNNPLYIFVSAKSKDQLNKFISIAEEAVKEYGDKVEVKGFVAEIDEED